MFSKFKYTVFITTIVVTLFGPGRAWAAHGHLTLTQQSGKLIITTYGSEPQNSIGAGQVHHHGQPAELDLTTPVAGGTFDGFWADSTFTLTSDAFASVLGAGDFYYQVAITAHDGSPTDALAGHGSHHSQAVSNAATRTGRSMHLPVTDVGGGLFIGSHPHGQQTSVDTPGTYRVVLTAWDKLYEDTNGAAGYADSDPVFFLVQITAPVVGDLNGDGFVGIEDLNIVLGNWNQNVTAGDPLQGDPSADSFVGIEDLNIVLGNWNGGTPPASTALIPEPASGLLLVGVLLAAAGPRRRLTGRDLS